MLFSQVGNVYVIKQVVSVEVVVVVCSCLPFMFDVAVTFDKYTVRNCVDVVQVELCYDSLTTL